MRQDSVSLKNRFVSSKQSRPHNTKIIISIGIVFLFLMVRQAFCQQLKVQGCIDFFSNKDEKMLNYSKDFQDFANPAGSDLEFSIASDFQNIAEATGEYVDTAGELLLVYKNMSLKEDRDVMKKLIHVKFEGYVAKIGYSMKSVNTDLSYTKRPAIADEGILLKNDLRQIKSSLKSCSDLSETKANTP